MTPVPLDVPGFPGCLVLFAEATPAAARASTHAISIPRGWSSSRSYRDGYGLLAAAPVRVGVDIEHVDESVTSDAVLTPIEAKRTEGAAHWCAWWSAKEALAKALGDAKNYDPRRLESPALWPNAGTGRWRTQQLRVPAGYVAWVVWEQPSDVVEGDRSAKHGA